MTTFNSPLRCPGQLLAAVVFTLFAAGAADVPAEAGDLLSAIGAIDTEYSPTVTTLGDFNGDGKTDIAAGYYDTEQVAIFLGHGDGTFSESATYPQSFDVGFLESADLDNDGNADLAGMVYTYGSFFVLLGNGDGTFEALDDVYIDSNMRRMMFHDITGDSLADMLMLVHDGVELYPGNGDGTFDEPTLIPAGQNNAWMDDTDLNGDGILDLALVGGDGGGLVVLLGDGAGGFTVGHTAPTGNEQLCVAAGDLDGDDVPDLCVGTEESGQELMLYFGNGDGTFGDPVLHTLLDDASHICLDDLDRDGHLDLLVQNDFLRTLVSVLIGQGDGTFAEPVHYNGFVDQLRRASLADINGDDTPDLICGTGNDLILVARGRGDGTLPTNREFGFGSIDTIDTGDLDGDGDPDMVASGYSRLQVFFNEGGLTFSTSYDFMLEGYCHQLDLFDLDGDPIADLVVCGPYGPITVYTGNGDGTFLIEGQYEPEAARQVLPCDLNNDGRPDLAAAAGTGIHVLLGLPGGGFGAPVEYSTGSEPLWIANADLDGNGFDDLAAVDRTDDTLVILFNDGAGGFAAPVTRNVGNNPRSVQVADLDLDGDVDMVTAHPTPGMMTRFRNNGDGTFNPGVEIPVRDGAGFFILDDLDNDGIPDLTLAHSTSWDNTLSVLRGLGSGNFGVPETYIVAPGRNDEPKVCSADFDGDGDRDLMYLNASSHSDDNHVAILENLVGTGPLLVTGPGRGEHNPPRVRVTQASNTGGSYAQWSAYGVPRYGTNVACAELTGNGAAEVLTGPGPGAVFGPHVRGFRIDGTPLPAVSFLAYGTNKFGVNVAGGDIDNDGYDEIITGAGPGAVFGPHVRGWNWDGSGAVQAIGGISWFAYGTPKWGVNVCCGDLDGGGYDEIVTGAGPGAVYGPHVRGWNWDGGGPIEPLPGVSFLAYGTNKYGVNVCCGDIDGDGIDELVTGAGPGTVFGAHVRGWNWDGSGAVQAIGGISFFAYDGTRWGANVGCGDIDGDGIDELITGPGPDPSVTADVRCWNFDGGPLSEIADYGFVAYNPWTMRHGVKVAGVRAAN